MRLARGRYLSALVLGLLYVCCSSGSGSVAPVRDAGHVDASDDALPMPDGSNADAPPDVQTDVNVDAPDSTTGGDATMPDATSPADAGDAGDAADGGGEEAGSCTSCDDNDACTTDHCNDVDGCRHVETSACAKSFCALAAGCAWLDTDGDGLSDTWEKNGYVDLNCNGIDDGPAVDLPLPDADPAVPDVYVQYDWMDYGPMETPCNVNSDCSGTLFGLKKATCTGPALSEGFAGTCAIPCSVDSDCTSLDPTHATDQCQLLGVKQCVHTHDPALLVPNGSGGSKAFDAVIDAFARHSIHLHIVRGVALPHSHVLSFHTLEGVNPLSDGCEGGSIASGNAGKGKYADSFYDLKAGSFDSKRTGVYHYAIFAHYSACDTDAHCQACSAASNPDGSTKSASVPQLAQGGTAESSGNDLIVSLAHYINEVGNPPDLFDIGGTFMHELGHNLGLSHGGNDEINYKPNYLSVMNYSYELVGIGVGAKLGDKDPKPCMVDSDCPSGVFCSSRGCRRLDYSVQVLPTGTLTPGLLDEDGHLDEAAGLGSGNSSTFFFTDGACNFREAASDGPVDWDGDTFAGDDMTATVDLSPVDHLCGTITNQKFLGHADWSASGAAKFTFAFQCTAQGAD